MYVYIQVVRILHQERTDVRKISLGLHNLKKVKYLGFPQCTNENLNNPILHIFEFRSNIILIVNEWL